MANEGGTALVFVFVLGGFASHLSMVLGLDICQSCQARDDLQDAGCSSGARPVPPRNGTPGIQQLIQHVGDVSYLFRRPPVCHPFLVVSPNDHPM